MGRRHVSGSVWIEPKHGVPCRVCWRRNGAKQTPSPWFETRREALALRDALREKLAAERPILAAGQVIPLTECLARWLADRQAEGKMSASTAHRHNLEVLRVLKQTEWETVSDITPGTFRDWMNAHPAQAAGLCMRVLSAFLRWISHPKNLAQPLASGLALASPQAPMAHRPRATPEQVATLLDRAEALGQLPLVHCLLRYPWRPKSLLLLDIPDLDIADRERASMLLRKTKNGRDVLAVVNPDTADLLAQAAGVRASGRVFLRPDGTPWPILKSGSSTELSKWFRKRIAYDMPHVAYDGKRASLSELAEVAEGDIPTIAELAGISKQTALRYLQTNEQKKRAILRKYAARQGAVRGQKNGYSFNPHHCPQPDTPDFTVDFNSTKLHQTPGKG